MAMISPDTAPARPGGLAIPRKRRRAARAAALAALLLPAALASGQASGATEILDSVVAIVEDDVVTASELRERLALVRQSLESQGLELPEREVLVRETLDRLVLESIQLQMGQRAGVRINDAQLNAALASMAAQRGLSLEQFSRQLEEEGKSYPRLREDMRRELILQRVQAGNVNQRVQITGEEARNFLASEEGQALTREQYQLLHALLPLPEGKAEVAAARAHVRRLHRRIEAGEDFAEVIESSALPYRFTSGDLGWRAAADLPSIFREVAPGMAVGETSAPIENPAGFHLVFLADKRGGEMVVSQARVRHILIKPSAIRDKRASLAFTNKLRKRITDGTDFAELARAHSEDIGSAQEGGELGWVSPGQMVPEFEAAMMAARIGEVSQPVESQFGWHLLEVLERRRENVTDVVAMNRARDVLHKRKFQEELQAWLHKIRDQAFVDLK